MRVDIPFEVDYLTAGTVPIEDVIDSLISAKLLIEEGGYNLSHFVTGLQIESVQVSVQRITQQSPLRELLLVAVYLAVQKDLEREVPAMVEALVGTPVPENFKTILTLSVMVALFYGVAYVKDLVSHVSSNSRVKKQLNALVKDIAERTGKNEDEIRKLLDERYKPKSRMKSLAAASVHFFKPSKSQSNAPIRVNDQEIPRDVVSDVPAEYSYEEVLDAEMARSFPGVDLELHAQDRDRENTGWAAVPKGVSDRRLRMKLMDGVTPNQLWGRNHVRGDIVIKYKRVGMDMVPTEIHLTRVMDS